MSREFDELADHEHRELRRPEAVELLSAKSAEEIAAIAANILKLAAGDSLMDIFSEAARELQEAGSSTMLQAGKIMAVHANPEVRKAAYWRLEPAIATDIEVRELLWERLNDDNDGVAGWYDDNLIDFLEEPTTPFSISVELLQKISEGKTRRRDGRGQP